MGKKIARIIGRVLLVVLVTIVMLVGTLFIMIKRICSDSAPAARNLFISTVLESGQMKFLASWFCTDAQINEVINANKMESMDSDIDTSLINSATIRQVFQRDVLQPRDQFFAVDVLSHRRHRPSSHRTTGSSPTEQIYRCSHRRLHFCTQSRYTHQSDQFLQFRDSIQIVRFNARVSIPHVPPVQRRRREFC